MQVMLIEDIVTVGRVGDVVEVKNGYARNYLIPQGLAIPATKSALKQADQLRKNAEKRRAREMQHAQDFANVLGTVVIRFERRVGDKGRLYGSVTNSEIAERIEQALELQEELDKRKVELPEPLKTLGTFEVPVHVHPDVPAMVRVEVVGENGETAADFAEEEVVPAELAVETEEFQPDGDY
jgi:large subunit ribosomal protein L9